MHQENFNYRSPNALGQISAHYVDLDGDFYRGLWDVDNSYGRNSPYLSIRGMYLLQPDGNIGVNWDTSSYGMIYNTNNKFKLRSPDLDYGSSGGACRANSGGIVDGYYWSVTDSYGNTLRRNPIMRPCIL